MTVHRVADFIEPLVQLGLIGPISAGLIAWVFIVGTRHLFATMLPRPRRRRRRICLGVLAMGSVGVLWSLPTTPAPNELLLGSPAWFINEAGSMRVVGDGLLIVLLSSAMIVAVCVALEHRETQRSAAVDRLQCEHCGYLVGAGDATRDRCPECGQRVAPLEASPPNRSSPRT